MHSTNEALDKEVSG